MRWRCVGRSWEILLLSQKECGFWEELVGKVSTGMFLTYWLKRVTSRELGSRLPLHLATGARREPETLRERVDETFHLCHPDALQAYP